MPAAQYFGYGVELMKVNAHVTDWSMIARLKRIGIEPGKSFDLTKPLLRSVSIGRGYRWPHTDE